MAVVIVAAVVDVALHDVADADDDASVPASAVVEAVDYRSLLDYYIVVAIVVEPSFACGENWLVGVDSDGTYER